MKNIFQLALVLTLCFSSAACKTNKQDAANVAAANTAGYNSGYNEGQSASQANVIKAANLVVELQKQFGASSNFELVKFGKDNPNYAVIHFTGASDIYVGVDISHYVSGTDWGTYSASNSVFSNLVDNGDGTYACFGGCWQAGNGPATTNMVFEKTAGSVKDLEKVSALAEAYKIELMAGNLAVEFGLSEERSLHVAKLASAWDRLAKSRALTDADADHFSIDLTGMSMNELHQAEIGIEEGSVTLDAALQKPAAKNGITSENMASILLKLFL